MPSPPPNDVDSARERHGRRQRGRHQGDDAARARARIAPRATRLARLLFPRRREDRRPRSRAARRRTQLAGRHRRRRPERLARACALLRRARRRRRLRGPRLDERHASQRCAPCRAVASRRATRCASGDVSVALHVLTTVAGVQRAARLRHVPASPRRRARSRADVRASRLAPHGRRARARSSAAEVGAGRCSRSYAPSIAPRSTPPMPCSSRLPETTRAVADALGAALVASDAALRFGAATFPEDGTTVDELLDARAHARWCAVPTRDAPPSPRRRGHRRLARRCARCWDMIDRVAPSILPVLVHGETGTGKEVVARALHATQHAQGKGPLRSVNCAAIPPNLVESVLFGHEKGAFTGRRTHDARASSSRRTAARSCSTRSASSPPRRRPRSSASSRRRQLVRVGGDREHRRRRPRHRGDASRSREDVRRRRVPLGPLLSAARRHHRPACAARAHRGDPPARRVASCATPAATTHARSGRSTTSR